MFLFLDRYLLKLSNVFRGFRKDTLIWDGLSKSYAGTLEFPTKDIIFITMKYLLCLHKIHDAVFIGISTHDCLISKLGFFFTSAQNFFITLSSSKFQLIIRQHFLLSHIYFLSTISEMFNKKSWTYFQLLNKNIDLQKQ